MLQTIQGIYRNGKIELSEIPQDITESQVFVTFFKPESVGLSSHFMSFGMFSGTRPSTETDFRDTEFSSDLDSYHIEIAKYTNLDSEYMNINLDLPNLLEQELSSEAKRLNLSLADYILKVLMLRREFLEEVEDAEDLADTRTALQENDFIPLKDVKRELGIS